MGNARYPAGLGFKFKPNDIELLIYLRQKANGEPLPCEGLIPEIDLYGVDDPGKLFKGIKENALVYVFTKLKKVSKNGKRVDRTVLGNRTWKGVDGVKAIYDSKGCVIGEKKSFVLINKMKMRIGYNMKEFSLAKDSSRFCDYVLCQIKKKEYKPRSLKYGGNCPEEDLCYDSVSIPEIGLPHSEGYECNDDGSKIVVGLGQSQQSWSSLVPPPPMLFGGFYSAQEFGYRGVDSSMNLNGIEEFHQNKGTEFSLSVSDTMINSVAFNLSRESFSESQQQQQQQDTSNLMQMILCGGFDSNEDLMGWGFFEPWVQELSQDQEEQSKEFSVSQHMITQCQQQFSDSKEGMSYKPLMSSKFFEPSTETYLHNGEDNSWWMKDHKMVADFGENFVGEERDEFGVLEMIKGLSSEPPVLSNEDVVF